MLELSIINQYLEDLIFTGLSCGLIIFSLLAVVGRSAQASIINFFVATVFLLCIILLISNPYFGIGISILYVSLCSMFMLTERMSIHQINYKSNSKVMAILVLVGVIFFTVLYYKLSGGQAHIKMNANYEGISGITLSMCTIFIITAAGISFLTTQEKKSNSRKTL
ncbi:MAG: hypothetical protein LBF65_03405 [Holosporales bacterium]|jgi:hypothetical protein|nr:hypothetical protein [Holosporales bacterium]